jgi:hypothetical protein
MWKMLSDGGMFAWNLMTEDVEGLHEQNKLEPHSTVYTKYFSLGKEE